MKYIMRELKGTFGYIRKQTLFEAVKTVVLFAMALGIFMIGYKTLGTKKSLWSVFAILALLPASKSLVGLIMLLRFRSLPESEYIKLSSVIGSIPAIYESILTTSSKAYFVPVICCIACTVTVLIPDGKYESAEIKKHIETVLNNGGHKAVVKVFDNKEEFIARINQMNENLSDDSGASSVRILNTLKAVSL